MNNKNWLIVHFYMPIEHPNMPNVILGYSRRASTLRLPGSSVVSSDGKKYVIGENGNLIRVKHELGV